MVPHCNKNEPMPFLGYSIFRNIYNIRLNVISYIFQSINYIRRVLLYTPLLAFEMYSKSMYILENKSFWLYKFYKINIRLN